MQRAADAIKSVLPGHKDPAAGEVTTGTGTTASTYDNRAAGTGTTGTGLTGQPSTAGQGIAGSQGITGGQGIAGQGIAGQGIAGQGTSTTGRETMGQGITGQQGIGRQGMTGQTGTAGVLGQTSTTATSRTAVDTDEEIRTRVRAPVVHEEIREREEVRIRPEVEREVIRPEIQQVVQPIQEHVVAPTQVARQQLETQVRETSAGRSAEDERRYREQAGAVRDTTQHAGVQRSEVREQERVTESVRAERYQEIQPVIERVMEKPKVVEVTQEIREIVHEAPKVHELKVNAPISIEQAAPLLKGRGKPIDSSGYTDYARAESTTGTGTVPGAQPMHESQRIPQSGAGHELKREVGKEAAELKAKEAMQGHGRAA